MSNITRPVSCSMIKVHKTSGMVHDIFHILLGESLKEINRVWLKVEGGRLVLLYGHNQGISHSDAFIYMRASPLMGDRVQ